MFTQGLEKELNKLSELNLEDYRKTSLGKFLSNDFDKIENNENNNLIEVLPLNNEQREAVQSSLNNSLTRQLDHQVQEISGGNFYFG